MSAFLQALHSGRVLLMDGAMGTELQRLGMGPDECGESWNVKRTGSVRAVHDSYIAAGAKVLLTNSRVGRQRVTIRHFSDGPSPNCS